MNVVFKYNFSIKNILTKNKPRDIDSSVYSIPCSQCPKQYIGETNRFSRRLTEHKGDIRRHNQLSSLYVHMTNNDHLMDFKNSTLLYKSSNYIERRVIESCLIKEYPNCNLSEGNFKPNPIIKDVILKQIGSHAQPLPD